MAARPQLTRSGLLSEPYGDRPYTVRLREEKRHGTPVLLDYTDLDGSRRKDHLGFAVRRRDGRRWAWNEHALERAREAARRRSAELLLGRKRKEIQPQTITVGDAFDRYLDPDRGALGESRSYRAAQKRAARVWKQFLEEDTPWNRVTRADVDALAKRYKRQGMVPTGALYVRQLRACFEFLDGKLMIEGLRNPTKGFKIPDYEKGHTPRRPRYTPEEVERIVNGRHAVDPRWPLFVMLLAGSGTRRVQVLRTRRSAVDVPLEPSPWPTGEEPELGWVVFPPVKGQRPHLWELTPLQRAELERAFAGYLKRLEARWEEDGVDYPLFPGVRLLDKADAIVSPRQPGSDRPASEKLTELWLAQAERAADVESRPGRAFHAFRREASDYLIEQTDLGTLTVGLGWHSEATPEQIYVDRGRWQARRRASQAMAERWQPKEEPNA